MRIRDAIICLYVGLPRLINKYQVRYLLRCCIFFSIMLMTAYMQVASAVNQITEVFTPTGHQGEILATAFSRDGRYMATGSADQTVKLWDVNSGSLLRTFSGHVNSVAGVAFTPDGKTLVSAADNVILWDINSGRQRGIGPVHTLGKAFRNRPGYISFRPRILNFVSLSSDGRLAISGGSDEKVKLWDTGTRAEILTFSGHKGWVNSAIFSPDNNYVLSAGTDGVVLMWDVNTGFTLMFLKGHKSKVISTAFSASGRLAATGDEDGTIIIWDVVLGREKGRLLGHRAGITSIHFVDSDQNLVTTSLDKSVKVWSVSNMKLMGDFIITPNPINTSALSSNGRFLVVGGYQSSAVLWETTTARPLIQYSGYVSWIRSVDFSPDGRYLAVGTYDGVIKLWELQAGNGIEIFYCGSGDINEVRFYADGQYLLARNNNKMACLLSVSKRNRSMTEINLPETGPLALSPDSKYLAVGGKSLQVLEFSSGQVVWKGDDSGTSYNRVFYTDYGRQVIGVRDNNIDLWDAGKKSLLHRQSSNDLTIESAALSPSGNYLVTYGFDVNKKPSVVVWKVRNDKILSIHSWQVAKMVTAAEFMGNGNIALGMINGSISLWNFSGRLISQLKEVKGVSNESGVIHFVTALMSSYKFVSDMVTSLKSIDGGKLLLSGDAAGSIALWWAGGGPALVSGFISIDDEWGLYTINDYYDSSAEGGKYLSFRTVINGRLEAFSVEQYSEFNRNPEMVRSVFRGRKVSDQKRKHITPPSLTMNDHMRLKKINGNTYKLHLAAKGDSGLRSIRVFNNGKPAKVQHINTRSYSQKLEIKLQAGVNRLTALAFDDKGFSSNPRYVDVVSGRKVGKPALYILAAGISKYPGLASDWSLDYADSDAERIVAAFKQQEGKLYSKVHDRLLQNDAVSSKKLFSTLAEFKQSAGENDTIIIFLAGHALRTKKDTFHFLTTESTQNDMQQGSINWENIRNHLEGMHGKTVMFLDACHSGAFSADLIVPNDTLAGKLFSREKGGLVVFSASKSRQLSVESRRYGGGAGVFSHTLVKALTSGASADLNGNGTIEFGELVKYTMVGVNNATHGRQMPWLSRREIFGDFPIASAN